MDNLVDKISKLTTIDTKILNKLMKKVEWCICDDIYLSMLSNNHRCSIDIGIGSLVIDFSSGDLIRYKFIPSNEFEKGIVNTIVNKENPIVTRSEQSLVSKISNTYKDLF